MELTRMWIGGRWTAAASGQSVCATNPATEQTIACLPQTGEADVAKAGEAARDAFPGWSAAPVEERSGVAAKISRVIREHAADLGARETAQRGTPLRHAVPGFLAAADAFETASQVGKVVMNQLIDSGPTVPYYLKARPVGVCSFALPWHAPFRMVSQRLASALVAGNTCIVECPEHDSLAALRLVEIADSLGVPPGVLNILTPRARTGMDPAAFFAAKSIPFAHVLPRPLPFIVLEDGDVDIAVEKALLTAFGNSGLAWALPGRYYVHERLYDVFARKFVEAAERLVVGDPADPATDIGPALSVTHRDNVLHRIGEETRRGAMLLCGGDTHADRLPRKGYFLSPTILGDMDPDADVEGPEIFGPIACLSPISSTGEILDLADRQKLGPCVQICTRNPAEQALIETALSVGSLWWEETTSAPADVGEEYPECAYARAGGDFAWSIRFGVVYKDYTASFVGRNPPHQN